MPLGAPEGEAASDRARGSGPVEEGDFLWRPPAARGEASAPARYSAWLEARTGRTFGSYEELWQWSVTDLEGFWASVWDYFEVGERPAGGRVLGSRGMPGAEWFPGVGVNYAQHALRRRDDQPALIAAAEDGGLRTVTYRELAGQVGAVASALRRLGVTAGDRVVGYLPNGPEAVIASLAAASLGAIWSSCPPEFGIRSVVDRFAQVDPVVLFAVDHYRYNGRIYDRSEDVARLRETLSTLRATVVVPGPETARRAPVPNVVDWDEVVAQPVEPVFEPVPFDHPLWILYSSGTTGLPKAIVHGHGGILLEHLKALTFHLDVGPQDRFFWFTTTGWMMWNFLVSGLLVGSTVVLYDGSPGHPDLGRLWRLAEETRCTYFGTSGTFLQACMKAELTPATESDLSELRGLGVTGSPLSPEGFAWVYDQVSDDVHLGSFSGGTDVCTGFVGPFPTLPVHAGEIQCRMLGAKVEAFDEDGRSVVDQVGELVLTEPLPSMPVGFWNDPDGHRYRESYFDRYPGVWQHGDWIRITPRGSCVIYGRSDATLNRGGVRMGTSDFYRVVEELPEVVDSLVVDTGQLGREGRLVLFVVLRDGTELDDEVAGRIRSAVRTDLSPRHVPDEIHAVPGLPRTHTGKKLEVPVRRLILGADPDSVLSRDAVANPDALDSIVELARGEREGRA